MEGRAELRARALDGARRMPCGGVSPHRDLLGISPEQGAPQPCKGERVWETYKPVTLPGAWPGMAELHDCSWVPGSLPDPVGGGGSLQAPPAGEGRWCLHCGRCVCARVCVCTCGQGPRAWGSVNAVSDGLQHHPYIHFANSPGVMSNIKGKCR